MWQTGLVKQKFMEAIQNYQTVEQQYRQKYKQRLERQYKIGMWLSLTPQKESRLIVHCSQARCIPRGSQSCRGG